MDNRVWEANAAQTPPAVPSNPSIGYPTEATRRPIHRPPHPGITGSFRSAKRFATPLSRAASRRIATALTSSRWP